MPMRFDRSPLRSALPGWLTPLFAFVALALAGARTAHAQAAHWENADPSPGGNAVLLVFEDCEPDGDPQLPPIANATLTLGGRSSSFNMVNGSTSSSIILTYFVQARRAGALQIPAFTVKTNKGPAQVAAFNGAAPAITADSVAKSKLTPERTTVWAGEVFGLTYELTAARRNNPQINPTFEWNPSPLVAEDWSKPEVKETMDAGQRELDVIFRTRVYAKNPNTVKLEAASHPMAVQTGSVGFGLFTQARMEPVTVTSDQPIIEIRALPTPAPGFSGAVGSFKFTSKVVPQKAAIGEPVTWSVELSGTGNWPDITGLPQREVSKDFQVVQPKAKRTMAEGKLFDATLNEDVVLIPTKAGTYTLPSVKFVYFNPQTGTYETLRTDPTTVTITQPAAPQFPALNLIQPSEPQKPAATEPTAPARPVTAPAAPAGIPRDPLPGTADAARPMTNGTVALWLTVPLIGVVLGWLALAWRRARRTDPMRPQREAHARVATVLAELRSTPNVSASGRHLDATDASPLAQRLLRWQHDSAVLWQIRHAAPSASAIPDIEWSALWREADRTLYGAGAPLPSDWVARAEAALAGKRVPGFQPIRLFLPQNLLPFAAAVALSLASITPHLHAKTPAQSYNEGDFATAEKAWTDAVQQHPTDWIARHNLALALAQEDRTGEAAAQASAALVQHPTDPSVRWHFDLMAEKAGYAPAPLIPFLKEGPVSSVATLASPAEWQRILIVTAFVLALALGWMLVNAYGRSQRIQFWAAGALAMIATFVGAIALLSYATYAETADRRAVIAWHSSTLRSIPTEADTTQKTTTLAAGSVAILDKTFLDWDHLSFPNGQTGWVRKQEVVPIWR